MNSSSAFQFQKFTIKQEHCAMKIGIDSVLLGAWCPLPHHGSILDIGTGTGVLSLMLAQRSTAKIEAIEIEQEAFEEAQENCASSIYKDQISIFHCPLQAFQSPKQYALIISNPPYFNTSSLSDSAKRTTARQQTALHYEAFLSHSKRLLAPEGQLVFILPSQAIDEISAYAKKQDWHIKNLTLVYGKAGKKAKRCLFILQQSPCLCTEHEFYIRQENNQYTEEFYELTKDFYLASTFR